MPPTDPVEIIDSAKIRQTGESIADLQLPSGMIPWFPNGHADPWNHIEAAMALDVAGLDDEADSAYQWLADIQLENGSWHNYYFENEIYSIDARSGIVNWKQTVNSSLTPTITENFVITVSNEGYLYAIEKNKGNIIRVTDLFKIYKQKKRKNIYPI